MIEKRKTIWLPSYMCPSVADSLKEFNIKIYHIDKDFMPIKLQPQKEDMVLWANYYGIQKKEIIEAVVKKYPNLIIDNSQSFFSTPYLEVYNIYSCRKFFGVPDGAYIIKNKIEKIELESDKTSHETANYLFKSFEVGTNTAYLESLLNEKRIEESNLMEMSKLTQNLLRGVEYDYIKKVRKINYHYLHERLHTLNELKIVEEVCPMVYPLLIDNDLIRKHLIKNHIYVSQWWKSVSHDKDANKFERYLSDKLIPLPIDHRYNEKDMYYICEKIMEVV